MNAVLTHEARQGDTRADRQVLRLAGGNGTAGSGDGCDLSSPLLPELAFRIARQDRRFVLTAEVELLLNGEALPPGQSRELSNGDGIEIGDRRITFNVEFERAGVAGRAGLLPLVSALLIALLLLVELGIGLWLPYAINQPARWGREISQQRTYGLMDHVRLTVRRSLADNQELEPRSRATIMLLQQEIDRMALYLREHGDQVETATYGQMYEDLMAYYQTFTALSEGTFYPEQETLQLEPTLKQLLQEQSH